MSDAAPPPPAPKFAAAPSYRQKHARQLQKTEMCKFFLSSRCGKGSRCNFAHDPAEIRNKPDLNRTSMCKVFLTSGNCTTPNCAFAHDERELRTTEGFFKTKMCRFASSGRCKHGSSCRFAHSAEELDKSPPQQQRPSQVQLEAAQPSHQELAAQQMMGLQQMANAFPGQFPEGLLSRQQQQQQQLRMGQASASPEQFRGRNGCTPNMSSSDWTDSTSDQRTNRDGGSDQSTRADGSASVPTPEGSGDSGPEESQHSHGTAMTRRGPGSTSEDRSRQRRAGVSGRHCTTMMISNVPHFLTQGALVSLLEDLTVYMRGAFDFFYCPWDPYQDRNLGYAIVNFFARSVAAEFETQWSNQPLLPGTHGSKRLRIVPAALQGRAANLRHFSGFGLAHHADPRFRPLVRVAPNEQLRPMAIAEEIVEHGAQDGSVKDMLTGVHCIAGVAGGDSAAGCGIAMSRQGDAYLPTGGHACLKDVPLPHSAGHRVPDSMCGPRDNPMAPMLPAAMGLLGGNSLEQVAALALESSSSGRSGSDPSPLVSLLAASGGDVDKAIATAAAMCLSHPLGAGAELGRHQAMQAPPPHQERMWNNGVGHNQGQHVVLMQPGLGGSGCGSTGPFGGKTFLSNKVPEPEALAPDGQLAPCIAFLMQPNGAGAASAVGHNSANSNDAGRAAPCMYQQAALTGGCMQQQFGQLQLTPQLQQRLEAFRPE
eukprot:gb/GFBE01005510.1/.p1 GENE.gb/GFBE01005510.1/~~gb/GFBE01005510.1/.p1  ORF type:complete len:708 (+),score=124.66 gb/GFBE01005510.1/:1-2124(+)